MKSLLKFLTHVDGRDKGLKILQYSGKLALWGLEPYPTSPQLPATQHLSLREDVGRRMHTLVGAMSTARKIMRLSNWLDPMSRLHALATGKVEFSGKGRREQFWMIMDSFSILTGFLTNMADDIACLAIVGTLGPAIRKRWEPLAAQLWFLNICFNIAISVRVLRAAHDVLEETAKKNLLLAATSSSRSSSATSLPKLTAANDSGSSSIAMTAAQQNGHVFSASSNSAFVPTPIRARKPVATTATATATPAVNANNPNEKPSDDAMLLDLHAQHDSFDPKLSHYKDDSTNTKHEQEALSHAKENRVATAVAAGNLQPLRWKQTLAFIGLIKLLADGGFCGMDVFPHKMPSVLQSSFGLASAFAGSYLRWVQS